MTEYRRMLATRERCADFELKLLDRTRMLNRRLDPPLPDHIVATVATRVAGRVAVFEHMPMLQRERQRKAADKRRRRNRGRDLQILRLHEYGESPAAIAAQLNMSRSGVRHVLSRDNPPPADAPDVSSSAG